MDLEHLKEVVDSADCLYNEDQVELAIACLAKKINTRLSGTNPVFLCVMVGGIVPTGSLLPRLTFPLELDYVHVTRYGGKTKGGELRWVAKHRLSVENRTVVVVDDILDSGHTLKAVIELCQAEGSKEVYTVVLIDRQGAREPGGLEKADFTGLEIDNRYVFGYGLDYKDYLRNAVGIYAIAKKFEVD